MEAQLDADIKGLDSAEEVQEYAQDHKATKEIQKRSLAYQNDQELEELLESWHQGMLQSSICAWRAAVASGSSSSVGGDD